MAQVAVICDRQIDRNGTVTLLKMALYNRDPQQMGTCHELQYRLTKDQLMTDRR
jgi:hypothetical protein